MNVKSCLGKRTAGQFGGGVEAVDRRREVKQIRVKRVGRSLGVRRRFRNEGVAVVGRRVVVGGGFSNKRLLIEKVRSGEMESAAGMVEAHGVEFFKTAFDFIGRFSRDCIKVGRVMSLCNEYDLAYKHYQKYARGEGANAIELRKEGEFLEGRGNIPMASLVYGLALDVGFGEEVYETVLAAILLFDMGMEEKALGYLSGLYEEEFLGIGIENFWEVLAVASGDEGALDLIEGIRMRSVTSSLERMEFLIEKGRGDVVFEVVCSDLSLMREVEGEAFFEKELGDKLKLAVMVEDEDTYEELFKRGCLEDKKHKVLKGKSLDLEDWPAVQDFFQCGEVLGESDNRDVGGFLLEKMRFSIGYCMEDASDEEGWGGDDEVGRWESVEMNLREKVGKLVGFGGSVVPGILKVVHVLGRRDPRFSIGLFSSEEKMCNGGSNEGVTHLEYRKIGVMIDVSSRDFSETLMHEFTHLVMELIFDNDSSPYGKGGEEAKRVFEEGIREIEAMLEEKKDGGAFYRRMRRSFTRVRLGYKKDEYDSEYIARYVEAVITGEDEEVRSVLRPIEDYWGEYIGPAIEAYVKKYEVQ